MAVAKIVAMMWWRLLRQAPLRTIGLTLQLLSWAPFFLIMFVIGPPITKEDET